MIMMLMMILMMMLMMLMIMIMMTNIHLLDIVVMVNKKSEYSCSENKELYSEKKNISEAFPNNFFHLNVSRSEEIVPAYLTKTR